MPHTISALAEFLGTVGMPSTVEGNANQEVHGVATLEEATQREISFLSNPKYESALETTRAGAVIVGREQALPRAMTVLRTKEPYAAMTAVMVRIHGHRKHEQVGIHADAVVDKTAKIGENPNIHHRVTIKSNVTIGKNVVIYSGCYIAEGCRIGDNCLLYPNVTLYEGAILGNRVTIHAGSVIGEDGLGYAPVNNAWVKIPQIGIVEIADDVEIGANCAIDRATLGRTVIGKGTKFSNLIAIGHGTKIGEHCMFVAQVGLAGSVNVGSHVTMAGKVGVAGHLSIGDNVELAAMTGVMKDIPANARMAGAPAMPIKEAFRSIAVYGRLPELEKQVKQLEAKVAELTQALEAAKTS